MRIVAVICLLIACRSFSQTPAIKVRKPLSQAESPWVVTLCGKYSGTISSVEILKEPQFRISGNTAGLRIISYEIISRERGKLAIRSNISDDSLNTKLKSYLPLFDKKSKLVIDEIRAVTNKQDTIDLNPLAFRFLD